MSMSFIQHCFLPVWILSIWPYSYTYRSLYIVCVFSVPPFFCCACTFACTFTYQHYQPCRKPHPTQRDPLHLAPCVQGGHQFCASHEINRCASRITEAGGQVLHHLLQAELTRLTSSAKPLSTWTSPLRVHPVLHWLRYSGSRSITSPLFV